MSKNYLEIENVNFKAGGNIKVKNVDDVKRIINKKSSDEDISTSLIDRNGEKREFVFQ